MALSSNSFRVLDIPNYMNFVLPILFNSVAHSSLGT
jgi:hypothetical protein